MVDLAVLVGVAEGLADPLGVAEGEALGAGAAGAVYCSASSTGRKASLAVLLIRLIVACSVAPGMVTAIWSLPCCWTWAPELPVPLTRAVSTLMACCIA